MVLGCEEGEEGRKGGRRTQTGHGQGSVEFPLLFVSMSFLGLNSTHESILS